MSNAHDKKAIQEFCNFHGYSDIHPYEVIRKISDQTVEVRPMNHERITDPIFVAGGFSGHCVNNNSIEYKCTPNEEARIIRVRWSKAKNRWQSGSLGFKMNSRPIYHYDYNF